MSEGIKQMSWATYLFPGVNKATLMSQLAPSTDEEIFERISASTSSYTIESNEDTFKPDTVYESFIIKPEFQCLTGLCWWVSSCYG